MHVMREIALFFLTIREGFTQNFVNNMFCVLL
jgi:hypothetical protein